MLMLAAALLAMQEPRVDATLSARSVTVGEAVVYQIIVESDDAAPTRVATPAIPDAFEVLRSQDFSETQLSFPGGRSRRFRRELVLLARQPGSYTIPSAQLEIAGRVFHTPELQIVVSGGLVPAQPGSGRSRLRVEFIPDTVYVGQQALLRVEALIPDGRRPRRGRAPSFEPPQPGGFWTQELPQPRQSSIRLIGPDVYETHVFERAYFPMSPGNRVLEPATVLYEVRLDWLSGTRIERLESDSLRLAVRALPDADRPPAFSGAVGKFSLTASLDTDRVQAGQAATLVVEIRGEGNVKGLPPPVLPVLRDVDIMAAGDESENWVSDGVLHGSRRFRWMLVPETHDAVNIGTVEYAYFDPFERRYHVLRSEPLRFEVDGPAPRPVAGAPAADAVSGTVLDLRRQPAPDRLWWVRSPYFLAANAVPLLALLLVFVMQRRRARPVQRQRSGDAVMRAWRVRTRSPDLTVDALRSAFLRSLADALGVRRASLAELPALQAVLREHGVDESTISDAVGLLHQLDTLRFSPAGWDDAARDAARMLAGRIVARVAGATSSAAVRRSAVVGTLVLLAVMPWFAMAAVPHSDFEAGIAAYDAGDPDRAAVRFEAWLSEAPRDRAAWVNLGLAREATGQSGEALRAYLHALRLQPRDARVRARVGQLGAADAAARITPPTRLSGDEARLAAMVLWLLALAGLTLRLLRPASREGRYLAIAAATVLVFHGGVHALHTRQLERTAVAIAAPTMLRAGPALRSGDVEALSAGAVLRIVERRGDWFRVERRGTEGWLERHEVLRPRSVGLR